MASIEKRISKQGEISYRALVRIKGHPTVSKTFDTKTKAQQWAQRTEIAIKDGKYLPTNESNRRTLGELIDRYKTDILNRRPNVGTDILHQYDVWKELLGKYSLSAIKTDLIQQALNEIHKTPTPHGQTKAPATMNRYIAALSVVFSYAYKNLDWIDHNPVTKIRKYQEPEGRIRFLSDSERERLLAACKESRNPMLYPVVLLAIISGARHSELLNLRWEDVDLRSGIGRAIICKTKNKERRTISIVEPALSLFREMERTRGNSEFVFAPQRRTAQSHGSIRYAWYEALEKAKLENFRFHDLCHTTASYLAMNGSSLREIGDVLGHKTLETTKRYAHLSDIHQQQLIERVMTNTIFGDENEK